MAQTRVSPNGRFFTPAEMQARIEVDRVHRDEAIELARARDEIRSLTSHAAYLNRVIDGLLESHSEESDSENEDPEADEGNNDNDGSEVTEGAEAPASSAGGTASLPAASLPAGCDGDLSDDDDEVSPLRRGAPHQHDDIPDGGKKPAAQPTPVNPGHSLSPPSSVAMMSATVPSVTDNSTLSPSSSNPSSMAATTHPRVVTWAMTGSGGWVRYGTPPSNVKKESRNTKLLIAKATMAAARKRTRLRHSYDEPPETKRRRLGLVAKEASVVAPFRGDNPFFPYGRVQAETIAEHQDRIARQIARNAPPPPPPPPPETSDNDADDKDDDDDDIRVCC